MHLHLSAKDRNEILFLVQYAEHVVFLDVTNHAPFKDEPPGSYLAELHANALSDLESKIDAEKIAEDAATTAKVVKGINPRQKPDTK